MFQALSEKIHQAIARLKGHHTMTETALAPTLKEIQRALLAADVPYRIAKDFMGKVKEQSLGKTIPVSVSAGEVFTRIVYDELTALMTHSHGEINLKGSPAVVLVAGLQGHGKTTFVGKLAAHLKGKGHTVLVVAGDVYRPAAAEQLRVLSEAADVGLYQEPGEQEVLSIAKRAIDYAINHAYKVVIVDTAGRQSIDAAMMGEVVALKQLLQPTETLFVVDAMAGQSALESAKAFDQQLGFDGVVLTKMDSDTRGGVAIAITSATGKPIKLLSTGEKLTDLATFYPDRMAKRLLGMPDVLSWLEQAEATLDKAENQRLTKKFSQKQLDFNDLLSQLEQLKKIGGYASFFGNLFSNKAMKSQLSEGEEMMTSFPIIINSMTQAERKNPDLLRNPARVRRIILGSGYGRQPEKVKKMLKHFFALRSMDKKKLARALATFKQ